MFLLLGFAVHDDDFYIPPHFFAKKLARLAKDMCLVVRNENLGEIVATVHYTNTTRWTRSLQVFTSANEFMFTM